MNLKVCTVSFIQYGLKRIKYFKEKRIDYCKAFAKKGVTSMIKKTILPSLFFILITGCSLPVNDSKQYEEISPVNINIAAIGDSLTKGVGDLTNKGGYQPILTTELENEKIIKDINISQYGKKGLSSAGLVKKVNDGTIPPIIDEADVVIITIGGNDVMNIAKKNYRRLEVDQFEAGIVQYEKNVRKIIKEIKTSNKKADIYIVGIYNPFEKWLSSIDEFDEIMVEWNNKSKSIANSLNHVYYVEISDIFQNGDENLIYDEDYFHPNSRGYELMGKAIFQEVKKNTISQLEQ